MVMMMKIPKIKIKDFIRDIRRLGLRHKPFTAYAPLGYYEIELYPNPNNNLLMLKYCT
jgi:predicted RNase H-like nuclease